MVGKAVKVTDVPLQMLVLVAERATDGVTVAVILTVSLLLVAVVVDAQEALLVITQLTILPLLNTAE